MFLNIVIAQTAAITFIVWILMMKLNKNLIETGLRQYGALRGGEETEGTSVTQVIVFSHKKLKPRYSEYIEKTTAKYFGNAVKPVFKIDKGMWGGIIIKLDKQEIEYCMRKRLQIAFSR